jgi:hypothetical protein
MPKGVSPLWTPQFGFTPGENQISFPQLIFSEIEFCKKMAAGETSVGSTPKKSI